MSTAPEKRVGPSLFFLIIDIPIYHVVVEPHNGFGGIILKRILFSLIVRNDGLSSINSRI